MTTTIFYNGTKQSRTGLSIPLLKNGRTLFSEYNPEREIRFYTEDKVLASSGFILAAGLGDGSHIIRLKSEHPEMPVLVLERNDETISYLFENGICSHSIRQLDNVFLTTPENLEHDIKSLYLPVIHGSFLFHPVKNWINLFVSENGDMLRQIIDHTLSDIAADYATQARFGKLMHVNIMKNLRLISETAGNIIRRQLPLHKAAAILGAGPSLDNTISLIKEYRNDLYVIATDTAYRAARRNDIIPDMAVTLDGQTSSLSHFTGFDYSKTLFAADLCSNPSLTRHLRQNGADLFFYTSGHPLGTFFSDSLSSGSEPVLPLYNAGAGTVLNVALDMAVKAGFKNILLFGADFSYLSGKPYTKGTYLDDLFGISSSRLSSSESSFCRLCYRSELFPTTHEKTPTDFSKIRYTTPLLNAYRRYIDSEYSDRGMKLAYVRNPSDFLNNFHSSTSSNAHDKDFNIPQSCTNIPQVIQQYETFLKERNPVILNTILPFAAWLKEHRKNADISDVYDEASRLF